jgi:hypothetical protein
MNAKTWFGRVAVVVSTIAFMLGMRVSTSAQTVLIDFGNDTTYRSLSVINPDSNGNYWNSIQPGVLTNDLVDIQNNATTIDIGWNTPVGFDSFNGPAGPTGEVDDKQFLRDNYLPLTDIDQLALGNLGGALEGPFDFIASPGGADNRVRFQIQQLDPAKKYTLTFFGSHKFSTDTTTVYSVYSDNSFTTLVGTASLDVQHPVQFWVHNRDRVATISDLAPQADNILYVQFVGSTGNLGYLNDMQIEAVESPALPGDYNSDGKVDAADFVIWRKDPNAHGGDPAGYTTWRTNFNRPASGAASGSAVGAGTAAAIPEPASLVLAAVAATIGSLRRPRRAR